MRRVDESIRQVLAETLAGELADPRVGFITVTDVRTSQDLRTAHVYVSVLGDAAAREASLEGLRSAHGLLQRRVARELHLRRTPTLEFIYDSTTDRALRVDELLRERAMSPGAAPASVSTREQVLRELRAGERFVVVTHEHPDGDALGSLVAMQGVLRALGKDSVIVIAPEEFPLPQEYRFLALDGLCTAAPEDLESASRSSWTAATRAHAGGRAAGRRDDHQHRPPPRQHPLRHGEPRRGGGVLHGRARLGPDARAHGRRSRCRSPRPSTWASSPTPGASPTRTRRPRTHQMAAELIGAGVDARAHVPPDLRGRAAARSSQLLGCALAQHRALRGRPAHGRHPHRGDFERNGADATHAEGSSTRSGPSRAPRSRR